MPTKWELILVLLMGGNHPPVAIQHGSFDTPAECFIVREELIETRYGRPLINYQMNCIEFDPELIAK